MTCQKKMNTKHSFLKGDLEMNISTMSNTSSETGGTSKQS